MWPGYLRDRSGARLRSSLGSAGIPLVLDHASGHASVPDLQRLVAALNPGDMKMHLTTNNSEYKHRPEYARSFAAAASRITPAIRFSASDARDRLMPLWATTRLQVRAGIPCWG